MLEEPQQRALTLPRKEGILQVWRSVCLAALAQEAMKVDPFCGALMSFVSRRYNAVKILYWHRNGFVLPSTGRRMKRRELQGLQGSEGVPTKALAILLRAAELYRRQVALGLDGHPDAILKGRLFLREWFGGKIRLEPRPDGGLMVHWNQNVGALCKGRGSCGSGRVIQLLPTRRLSLAAA
jgi:hypothetical protein